MFLVCGEALFDLFMAPRTQQAIGFAARLGGSPYNVAMGLARLGAPVTFLGGIGTDVLGDEIRASLAREGVALGTHAPKPAKTTLSLVSLLPNGSPAYSFYGEGGAERAVVEADLPASLAGISALHVGSYSLVCEPVGSSLLTLGHRAKGQSLICLDPNVRLNVEPSLALWRARLETWLQLADLVKISEEDLELLYPGEDHEALLLSWLQKRPVLVCLTRGGAGAVAYRAQGKLSVPAQPVQVVDTVGAGDSFQAALIHSLGIYTREAIAALPDIRLQEVLAFAVQVAGITCARAGADLPRWAELE